MNLIYGVSPVLEALRSGRRPIEKLLLLASAQPERLRELTEAARRAGIACERRSRRELDELTHRANHQGVVALLAAGARGAGYVASEEILSSLDTQMGSDPQSMPHGSRVPLLVLLDGIEDPHNLGAILRTCEGAGVDGIFLPEHRAAGLSETVSKTSAGAIEHLRIARVTNLVPLIDELKEQGFWIAAVEGGSAISCYDFDMRVPLALVFGSEGKGVRRLVRERCDLAISIPMHGRLNSLNVSVAAGVVLFEARRQRSVAGDG